MRCQQKKNVNPKFKKKPCDCDRRKKLNTRNNESGHEKQSQFVAQFHQKQIRKTPRFQHGNCNVATWCVFQMTIGFYPFPDLLVQIWLWVFLVVHVTAITRMFVFNHVPLVVHVVWAIFQIHWITGNTGWSRCARCACCACSQWTVWYPRRQNGKQWSDVTSFHFWISTLAFLCFGTTNFLFLFNHTTKVHCLLCDQPCNAAAWPSLYPFARSCFGICSSSTWTR